MVVHACLDVEMKHQRVDQSRPLLQRGARWAIKDRESIACAQAPGFELTSRWVFATRLTL